MFLEYNLFGIPLMFMATDSIAGLINFSESLVPAVCISLNRHNIPVIDLRGTFTCSLITLSSGLEISKVLCNSIFS